MKPKKKKMSKTILFVIITTFSALILAGVFFATYYISIDRTLNSYEKNMKQAVIKINSLNNTTAELLKEKVIDAESSRKKLPDILKQFDSLKEEVEREIPGDKFKLQHTNIVEGLKANKLMYMQILGILQNPSSKDLKGSFQDFEKYRDDCENYYSQFSLGGVSPSVLNEAHEFLNAFKFYANQLIETQIDADMKSAQLTDFVSKLDIVVGKFIPLKTDFSIELKSARDNGLTYDELINLATEYSTKNSELEKEALKITAPENAKSLKNSFVALTNDYDIYIQSFITAVNLEKSESSAQTDPLTEEKLKEIYFDPSNRFLGIQDKYDNFLKKFTDYKSTNIK